MAAEIIEIDRPGDWPDELTDYVEAAVDIAGGATTYAELLDDGGELGDLDTGLRELLVGRLLRTFHATRLLDYEVADVERSGLRRLTQELVQARQDRALASSVITAEEHQALRESSVFKTDPYVKYRVGKVCVVGNQRPLHDRRIGDQFSFWGGEAQYSSGLWSDSSSDRVKKLGRPALVVALLDASDPTVAVLSYRELIYHFVGSYLGFEGVGFQIDYEADVPGDRIEAVWQPGDAEYDAFPRFPQG
ncbi:hypothetical protein ACFXDJ_04125 [Streptomyces sp. NPDC059443]|uniref:hypothetical protein n=1 Tax=unclassified Streptomyces TaxID=2593676 RepID=UPI003699D1E8